MSFRKDLLKQLEKLNKQYEDLKAEIASDNSTTDGEKDFASNDVISKRAFLDSVQQMGMIEKGLEDSVANDPIVKYSGQYKIYPEANMPIRYGGEMHDFISQIMSEMPIYSENEEQQLEIEKFLREGLMFDDACFYKDGNIWRAGIPTKNPDGTYGVAPIQGGDDVNMYNIGKYINGDGKKIKKEKGTGSYTNGVDLHLFNFFYDRIGIYIKAIPYLQVYLVYTLSKQKSTKYIQLICDSTLTGNSQINSLFLPQTLEIKNKGVDLQNLSAMQQETLFEKMRWYMPESHVDKVYAVLNLEIDKTYELLYTKFGIPVKAADDRQTLSSESNIFAKKSMSMYKYIISHLKGLAPKIGAIFGHNDELEKLTMEEFEEVIGESNGNDNAARANTYTEAKKRGKGGYTVLIMAYTFRNGYQDYQTILTNSLVNQYNGMTDNTNVQGTNLDEMGKILKGCFVALHRLNPLAVCGLDGQTYADSSEFAQDQEMVLQMQEVVSHNIILIVNNWRQTQFFQNDENGKDIAETKYNPIDNTIEAPTGLTTRAATVAYNLFDINLKADRNLQQVQDVLKLMYNEFAQYLVTGTKI